MMNIDSSLAGNILTEFGLDKLPADQQENALQQLGGVIFRKVMLKVNELLTEEQLKGLDQALALEEQQPGTVFSFLKQHTPNFDAVVNQEIAAFKSEALGVMQAAKTQAELP